MSLTANERRQIQIRTYCRPRSQTVRLTRHFQHPVRHRHWLTFLHRATRVRHQTATNAPPRRDGCRELRVRKSINYAKPKLNTKMRKPESVTVPVLVKFASLVTC
ncbi:hypothetical protein V8E53_010374, partial [Lactarius tabidus]